MVGFYDEMAAMVRDLTKPDTQGGLGQGSLAIIRLVPGVQDPTKPWEPVSPKEQPEPLDGAARGIGSKLVGTEVNGVVLNISDRVAITTVPSIPYTAGDKFSVDGKIVTVLHVENIPAAGIASAVRWFIRG